MSENCRYVCELFVITPPKIPLFSPSQQPCDRDRTKRNSSNSPTWNHSEISTKSCQPYTENLRNLTAILFFKHRKFQTPPYTKNPRNRQSYRDLSGYVKYLYLLRAWATSTAQATVHPTIGLLPIPRKPIISTWAGTEDEPANWASLCIRPMVSVRA